MANGIRVLTANAILKYTGKPIDRPSMNALISGTR